MLNRSCIYFIVSFSKVMNMYSELIMESAHQKVKMLLGSDLYLKA